MSFPVKVALVMIAMVVSLEGLFICLWPRQVKKIIKLGTPGQLRGAGLVEFLIGITVFVYCWFKL